MLVYGPLTHWVKMVLLGLTLLTALLSVDSEFTDHVGEFFALLLIGAVGMMFLAGSENLLMLFVSLELLSLCLYVLTAFNKSSPTSAEAGLKYFLFGGMSAAFLLFGMSLLYGLTGELNLPRLAARLQQSPMSPLLLVALLMVFAGFGFKVAAAPFHLWAPDAYEGAPAPAAALIASGSKVAAFFILGQTAVVGLAGAEGSANWGSFGGGWLPMLAVLAALSMVLGNLGAIVQTSVRRLLAYSAIAQGGYILLGILAEGAGSPGHHGVAAMLYYVSTYGVTVVGAFAVAGLVQDQSGSDRLEAFAGLWRRSPSLALALLVFMLSLAGIPPLAGFFAKFYVFGAALKSTPPLGLVWLVALAIGTSAISLYYYLQVLKQVFVMEPAPASARLECSLVSRVVVTLLAVAVLLLGCFPEPVLKRLLSCLE